MRSRGRILAAAAILGLATVAHADEDSSSDIDWLVHVTRSMPREVHGHVHREQSLAFINVNTRSDQQPLIGNATPHMDFSLWTPRPTAVGADGIDSLFADPLQPLLDLTPLLSPQFTQ